MPLHWCSLSKSALGHHFKRSFPSVSGEMIYLLSAAQSQGVCLAPDQGKCQTHKLAKVPALLTAGALTGTSQPETAPLSGPNPASLMFPKCDVYLPSGDTSQRQFEIAVTTEGTFDISKMFDSSFGTQRGRHSWRDWSTADYFISLEASASISFLNFRVQ